MRTQIRESISNLTDTFGGVASYLVTEPADLPGAGGPAVFWQVAPTGEVTVFAPDPYGLSSGIFVRFGLEWYGGGGIDAGHLSGAIAVYSSIEMPATSAIRIDAVALAFEHAGYGSIGGDLPGMAVDDLSADWLTALAVEDTFEQYHRAFTPSDFGSGSGPIGESGVAAIAPERSFRAYEAAFTQP